MASNLFLKPGQSVDDTLPNRDVVQRVFGLSVKDADGIEHPIQSLVAQHVILVFVRHHHCGMCMHYIADLAQDQRFASGSTKVIVIGHGSYQGIQRYKEVSKCPFEMYVDETKQVYEALGLTRRFLGKDHSEEVSVVGAAVYVAHETEGWVSSRQISIVCDVGVGQRNGLVWLACLERRGHCTTGGRVRFRSR